MGKDQSETLEKVNCYHCGSECAEEHIFFDDKDFCCQGCQTVYDILRQNDMCDYYDLESSPGTTLSNTDFKDKFAYLDNDQIQEKLLDFNSPNISRVTLYIPVIHCSSCIWLLENIYKFRDGISQSRVNFVKKQVTIQFDPSVITLREVVEALASIGYEPYISLEEEKKEKRKSGNTHLYLKIGVAAFCFGNIMLLSFPEYLGFEEMFSEFQRFFSYLNIVLSLPVMFYCSLDYFTSAWNGLKEKFVNIDVPIALGIIVLFFRSLYEVLAETGPGYFDSLAGLLFFLLVGRWFQSISYDSLSFERDYKSYFPLAINRVRDGVTEAVPVNQLEVNDEIIVRNQEIIPADSVLLSDKANIDYSFVTGESEPVEKVCKDYIYAGGRQVGESVRLLVQKPVSQSYLTQLWNNEIFEKEKVSSKDQMINVISKYFTFIVLFIAFASAAYWYFVDKSHMLNAFTAVLIIACPCALTLATPFTLGSVLRVFGRNKLYVKNASLVEHMAKISHMVFDKTGTLTHADQNQVSYSGEHLQESIKLNIASIVAHSTHPLSRHVFDYLSIDRSDLLKLDYYEEIEGKGIVASVGGLTYKIGSLKFASSDKVEENLERSSVHISGNDNYLGRFDIANEYRNGLDKLISRLTRRFSLSLLSGDKASEKAALEKIFPSGTNILFNQSPHDKLSYIKDLQSQGNKVMMLGDGLNDAGALKQSDIGIAVTDDIGSFTPASDAILDAKELSKLHSFLKFALYAQKVIIACFILSFLYNITGLSLAVTGNLQPVYAAILMPLSSISVVALATISVNIKAKLQKLL